MMMTPPESTLCKNKNSIFSALGLDRDLGFSRGHQGRQGHRPHDDDDPPLKAHCAKTKIQISQLWDLIETWGFHEDLKPIVLKIKILYGNRLVYDHL